MEPMLVIEADGGQHAIQIVADSKRTSYLEKRGFKVLRFWDNDVLKETEAVKQVIYGALGLPHPPLSPSGRG